MSLSSGSRKSIDLNCDIGEGFGIYRLGRDEEMLDLVTSANIACGFHGGDPAVMRRTVGTCLERGVGIGAHPGLPDRQGFGRRDMAITPEEAYELTLYQIGALAAFVRAEGGMMRHVKPHGALYNMAADNAELAQSIAKAVAGFDPSLILVGLAGSELIRAGDACGLRTAGEGFADRSYSADGRLTPRSREGALIQDAGEAARQVMGMVKDGRVVALSGEAVPLRVDTVCLHGDGPNPCAFARMLRQCLQEEGVKLVPVHDA